MVERQHRVGLAAAKIGLELHHGIAPHAGDPLHAAHEKPLEAFREIGAAKELPGIPVLVRTLAEVHLPQVRGELRLLVAPARHVGVRRNHLAPWLEGAGRRRLDQGAPGFALLAAHLLVVDKPPQFLLHLADVAGLRRRDGGQETVHGIQRAIRVVA